MLHAEERPGLVHRDDLVPFGQRTVEDVGCRRHAGIVDQHVEPAMGALDRRDGGDPVFLARHVEGNVACSQAVGTQRRRHGVDL
jgi:hypothetical protein